MLKYIKAVNTYMYSYLTIEDYNLADNHHTIIFGNLQKHKNYIYIQRTFPLHPYISWYIVHIAMKENNSKLVFIMKTI